MTYHMQDESLFWSNEAAVLGQLHNQKPSASFERPTLWNRMEEGEKAPKLAQVRFERFISEVASFREKLARLMGIQEKEVIFH